MRSDLPKARLGEPGIATIILGQSPPSSSYNYAHRGLPFYQGKADFGLVHPNTRIWCDAGQQFSQKNDILISVRAPVGDVNISDADCVIGRGVSAIRAGEKTDPWFLFFALQHVKPEVESLATGSTFASINKSTLLDIKIPFPTLTEQTFIAGELRKILAVIIHEQSIIEGSLDLKRSAMCELFTRGLRGEAQKETEFGLVPEGWQIVTLGSLSTETEQVDIVAEKEDLIEYIDVSSISRDTLTIDTKKQFTLRSAPGRARKRVRAGDIIFATIRPTLLRVAEIRASGIKQVCSTAFCVLRNNGKCEPSKFLYYIVQRKEFIEQLAQLETGASYPAVTDGQVKKQLVPVPPLEERIEIVEILNAIDRKIELHKKKKALLEELFKSLLHKLMTGEIRVADLDLSAIDELEIGGLES
jgi:type I restriction enzyme S subunit